MNGKRLCLRLVPLLLPPAALLLFCALRQNGVYTLFPYAGCCSPRCRGSAAAAAFPASVGNTPCCAAYRRR